MGTNSAANSKLISAERLIDNLSTAIAVVDYDFNVVCINSATENLINLSERRVQGMPIRELFAGSNRFIEALHQGKEAEFTLTKREIELIVPSNLKVFKVDCSFTPMHDQKILLVEMSPIDSKLRIAKEENIVAQQDVLKVLVRGLAHEVKNPLGGIRGAAQLLERELPFEELKEYTDVIIEEADRLQKLVDDMLGPNRPLRKELMNIHRVIERVRQLVLVESSESLTIVRDYDPSLPEIMADQDQMIQVILNIVRNAKQAINANGAIKIRTRSRRNVTIGQKHYRLMLAVEIIDNGPGVSPELMDKIFYPMVTGRAEGTGLGLSIAQTIVGQHGGIIECSSIPGETNFTLLMPINAEDNN